MATDQQPHTPLDDLVLRMHIHFDAANTMGDDYSADDFADVIRILENLAADIAAAEQRGAVRALRGAAHSPRLRDAVHYAIKHEKYADAARRSFENYLLQEANRADQEGGE